MVVVTYEGFFLRLVKSLGDLIIICCELMHIWDCRIGQKKVTIKIFFQHQVLELQTLPNLTDACVVVVSIIAEFGSIWMVMLRA